MQSLVILVTGDRNWTDAEAISSAFTALTDDGDRVVLIHGAARGADTLAEYEALRRPWFIESFPARWNLHGRAAGPIRNREMLDRVIARRSEGDVAAVLAFHDNLQESKGTRNMVQQALGVGLPVWLYTHKRGLTKLESGAIEGGSSHR